MAQGAGTIHEGAVEFNGGLVSESPLTAVVIGASQDSHSSWFGEGARADLSVHGAQTDTETGIVANEATPYSNHESFDAWSLTGGEFGPNHQIIIGTVPGQTATVSVSADGAEAAASSVSQQQQRDRFPHDVEPTAFDVADTTQWQADGTHTIRIEGDFVLTTWEATLRFLADGERSEFRSGLVATTPHPLLPEQPLVYSADRAWHELTVEDGFIEIHVDERTYVEWFTTEATATAEGGIHAASALLSSGESGALESVGAASVSLVAADGGPRIDLLDGRWMFDGELLAQPRSSAWAALPDPTEQPAWLVGLTVLVVLAVAVVAAEGTGWASNVRFGSRLRRYDYDRVQPSRMWRFFTRGARAKAWFQASVAAAGREDHKAAVHHAAQVGRDSKYWGAARFVSVQSLAARGQDAAAAFELETLIERDARYRVLALENPHLQRLVPA